MPAPVSATDASHSLSGLSSHTLLTQRLSSLSRSWLIVPDDPDATTAPRGLATARVHVWPSSADRNPRPAPGQETTIVA